MKIKFLGTGAADWPQEAAGAGFFRALSSALIDGVLLIDPGPCVPDALSRLGIDPKSIKYIINTHRHRDHFCEAVRDELVALGARVIDTCAGELYHFGGYTVEALAANHPVTTCHFLITAPDGKKLFYGLDGAWLLYPEVKAIKNAAPVDLAVLDATIGFIDGDYRIFEHNNLGMVIEMKKTLTKHVKAFCISHMAMTLHDDHEKLTHNMAEHGIEVAYDGFEKEL